MAPGVTIEFGDGATDQASVPAGGGVGKVSFEHGFPRSEARFEQQLSLAGGAVATGMITDVCPRATTKALPDDLGMCVRL